VKTGSRLGIVPNVVIVIMSLAMGAKSVRFVLCIHCGRMVVVMTPGPERTKDVKSTKAIITSGIFLMTVCVICERTSEITIRGTTPVSTLVTKGMSHLTILDDPMTRELHGEMLMEETKMMSRDLITAEIGASEVITSLEVKMLGDGVEFVPKPTYTHFL